MDELSTEVPYPVAELSGRTTIWPVWLRTVTRQGLTLWGGDFEDGSDRFLAVERKIVLFSTLDSLWAALPRLNQDTFNVDQFRAFRLGLGPALAATGADTYSLEGFDFAEVLDCISLTRVHIRENAGMALGCLNALSDIAVQFPNAFELATLVNGESLRTLYRVLWGQTDVTALDHRECRVEFESCVRIVSDMISSAT